MATNIQVENPVSCDDPSLYTLVSRDHRDPSDPLNQQVMERIFYCGKCGRGGLCYRRTGCILQCQCVICKKVFYTHLRSGNFCSGHCYRVYKRELAKVEHFPISCQCCGAEFIPRRKDAKFCSNACRQKVHRGRYGCPSAPRGRA